VSVLTKDLLAVAVAVLLLIVLLPAAVGSVAGPLKAFLPKLGQVSPGFDWMGTIVSGAVSGIIGIGD
jgi:hypothetical protein